MWSLKLQKGLWVPNFLQAKKATLPQLWAICYRKERVCRANQDWEKWDKTKRKQSNGEELLESRIRPYWRHISFLREDLETFALQDQWLLCAYCSFLFLNWMDRINMHLIYGSSIVISRNAWDSGSYFGQDRDEIY